MLVSSNTSHHVCFLVTRLVAFLTRLALARTMFYRAHLRIPSKTEKNSNPSFNMHACIHNSLHNIRERNTEHAIYNETKIIQMFSSYFNAATVYLNGGQEAKGNSPSTDETTSRNSNLPMVQAPIELAGARTQSKCNLEVVDPKDDDLEMAEHGFNTWYFQDEETGELIPSWKWPEMVSRYRNS